MKRIKHDVRLYGIRPEMVVVDAVVTAVFAKHGYDCTTTSAVGKKHKIGSLHPVGFAKDYRYYLKRERGFIYDFNTVFPALFTEDINLLIEELNKQLKCTSPSIYKESLKLFHAHTLEYNYAQNIYDNIQLLTQKVK